MSWNNITVGDLVERAEAEVKTGPFGTQLRASDYVETGTPVINVRNIGFGNIRHDKLEYIPDDVVTRLSGHLLRKGDIVFGRKGAVERHVYITDAQNRWFQGSDCLRLRLLSEANVLSKYLSFTFLTHEHQSWMMQQCSHGATMASLNQDIIKRIPLRLPSIEQQKIIVDILSTYDDLIENNTRRIDILEEMARLLYEEWFVHFRFPGHEDVSFKESELGEIPEGWEVCKLIDLVDFIGGAQPPKSQHIYEAKEGYVRFVQNRDYRSDGYLTYIPESKRNKICGRLDILVDKYGEAGKARFGIAGAYNVALAKIVPKNESYREWLRGFLSMTQTQEYLLGASQAATRPSLNKGHFNFPVVRPSESVAERFGHQVLPMLKLMLALKDKTANLRAQRDLLLPKLVSGEIDVSEIPMPDDKEVEAA
ncbi:restriction endonuclease subunit S [Pseudidiomarina sediminum]|uniref:Restriction endonuclease subunit S n=1 Tax=Pseudidiomarina sediminum TaxID=431675 RepID=A0A432Z2U0_9GAMM|nr:restriction endonuclease subunit S [Pseudidiomarina sediminum]RUO72195.1 restriction endonuclease subunit S [Pseudidiomarina sediminum]